MPAPTTTVDGDVEIPSTKPCDDIVLYKSAPIALMEGTIEVNESLLTESDAIVKSVGDDCFREVY